MKRGFELLVKGEEVPTVYRNLKPLIDDIGRGRQYQTFRRRLLVENVIPLGNITIRNVNIKFSKQS